MSRVQSKVDEAIALVHAGQTTQAMAQLQRLFAQAPRDVGVLSAFAFACRASAQWGKAEFYVRQLAAQMPRSSDAQSNLALVLAHLGEAKRTEAIIAYRKALELDPTNANARVGLANLFADTGQPALALEACEATPALPASQQDALRRVLGPVGDAPPTLIHPQLAMSHAAALLALVRPEEALSLLSHAARLHPPIPNLAILRCAALHSVAAASPGDIADAHDSVGQAISASLIGAHPQIPPFDAARTAATKAVAQACELAGGPAVARPLSIAIISPDLRTHSVAFFAAPLIQHLSRTRFTLHAFYNHPSEDAMSARLKPLFASWTNISSMPDEPLIAHLRAHNFDIALDLTGLTGNHRLRVLAARIAPLQATYCGYPDTTGTPSIDLRIVDATTDPPRDHPLCQRLRSEGQPDFDERCAERLARLPGPFLCFAPPPDAPEPRLALPASPIVFGSFNTVRKLNTSCIELWSRVLARVPGSRLLLKARELADPALAASLRQQFASFNVGDQLDIAQPAPTIAAHLATYERMHIALDTFPYHGTTTTCEAMWMGVPVITLTGDRHASRVGASLLAHAAPTDTFDPAHSVSDLVTSTPEEFVDAAVRLAHDAARITALRSNLRASMRASPLCDGPALARHVEQCLIDACLSLPPASR